MPDSLPKRIVSQLDLPAGATLLVSSDITALAFRAASDGAGFSCDGFIEAFQEALGQGGTLLFPTFNFDFCEGRHYDARRSPSMTGALSRTALARPDFKRTRHPIHSFAVWGRHREFLCGLDNKSSFGKDSPFAYLREWDALQLIIGLPYQGAFTFVHHVEEMESVPYRYLKNFKAPYRDLEGRASEREYAMYVRDLDQKNDSWVDPMGEILEARGVAESRKLLGVIFRKIRLKPAYDAIALDIRDNGARSLFRISR